MGILGIGYVSDRTVFYLTGTVVALAVICYLAQRYHTGSRGPLDHIHKDKKMTVKLANSAQAYLADTDKESVKQRIIKMFGENTRDQDILHQQLNQLVSRLDADLAAGAPLAVLLDQRQTGAIDQQTFRTQLDAYITQVSADLDIPVGHVQKLTKRYMNPKRKLMIYPRHNGDKIGHGWGGLGGWMTTPQVISNDTS